MSVVWRGPLLQPYKKRRVPRTLLARTNAAFPHWGEAAKAGQAINRAMRACPDQATAAMALHCALYYLRLTPLSPELGSLLAAACREADRLGEMCQRDPAQDAWTPRPAAPAGKEVVPR